jgi:hypothetical protein
VTALFDRFAEAVKSEASATYFLEKIPEHALCFSYLVEYFPRSIIVFVVRDSRDGIRSAKRFPSYWASLPAEDPVGGYLETWRESVEAYSIHSDAPSVILVRYEDFGRSPTEELSRIMSRSGCRASATRPPHVWLQA